MSSEIRKRTRVPVQFEMRVRCDKAEHRVDMINLSLTGVLCVTASFFQQNAFCTVDIKLSEDVQISLAGKILRVGEEETAISFTSMDEESFFHLKRIMEFNTNDAEHIGQEIVTPAFK